MTTVKEETGEGDGIPEGEGREPMVPFPEASKSTPTEASAPTKRTRKPRATKPPESPEPENEPPTYQCLKDCVHLFDGEDDGSCAKYYELPEGAVLEHNPIHPLCPFYKIRLDDQETSEGAIGPHSLPGPAGISPLEQKAEAVTQEIITLARAAELCFIDMGRLLKQVQDEALWGAYKYETFEQYCSTLDLPQKQPYKWVLGVVSIWEVLVEGQGIEKERLAKIGIAKCLRLVPLARKGELTEDQILLAEMSDTTDRVLRDSVGHSNDTDSQIHCPRCGQLIMGAKWVRPEDEAVKATQALYEGDSDATVPTTE